MVVKRRSRSSPPWRTRGTLVFSSQSKSSRSKWWHWRIYVCKWVCVCVHMDICMHIHISTHPHSHIYMLTYTGTPTHTHIHTHRVSLTPYIPGATVQDVDRISECFMYSNIRYHTYTHMYIHTHTLHTWNDSAGRRKGVRMSYAFEYMIPYHTYTHTPYILGETVRDIDRVSECHTHSNIRYHTHTHPTYLERQCRT